MDDCCIRQTTTATPAEPGALGLGPLKAAAGVADAAPNLLGHLKVAVQRNRFNWSRRVSSFSWFRMYSRIISSFRPTVDTKYPLAQKC